ncbi:MAG TPA: hypothetical protein VNA20_03800 [Frankiaceae bacterium]|nr:hypothetical protein [Frankiaceae bacterium]
MTGWHVALLLLAAAGLAYATRPKEPRRRWPKPGEGMRRRDRPSLRPHRAHRDGLPPELVRVRSVPAEEAHVAAGFLEAHGIDAGLRPRRTPLSAKGPARDYDIYVAAERADEARALLDSVRPARRR